jgi:hypothetical protein
VIRKKFLRKLTINSKSIYKKVVTYQLFFKTVNFSKIRLMNKILEKKTLKIVCKFKTNSKITFENTGTQSKIPKFI